MGSVGNAPLLAPAGKKPPSRRRVFQVPGKSLPLHLLPVGWPLLPPRFPRDATFHRLPRATPSSPFTPCQKVEGPAVPRRSPPGGPPPAVPLSRALHADRRYDVSGVARHLSRGAVRGALTYGPRCRSEEPHREKCPTFPGAGKSQRPRGRNPGARCRAGRLRLRLKRYPSSTAIAQSYSTLQSTKFLMSAPFESIPSVSIPPTTLLRLPRVLQSQVRVYATFTALQP